MFTSVSRAGFIGAALYLCDPVAVSSSGSPALDSFKQRIAEANGIVPPRLSQEAALVNSTSANPLDILVIVGGGRDERVKGWACGEGGFLLRNIFSVNKIDSRRMDEEVPIVSEPMNGGNGTYSYTKNSYYQRTGSSAVKEMIDQSLYKNLDVNKLTSNGSTTFSIVDMGCSVGPNTFMAVGNLLESVLRKYKSEAPFADQRLEFTVHFNDRYSNDFNTLFNSLPLNRSYFATAVPGTFHGRLFPKNSLHLVYSSYALQWLSRSPEICLDRNSPAWNGGRVHYARASQGVKDAYGVQLRDDFDAFFEARGVEVVAGGMMVMIIPGVPDEIDPNRLPNSLIYELMASVLANMVKRGVISEQQVDTFNLPIYSISPKDIKEAVGRNGSFEIERLEMMSTVKAIDRPIDWQKIIIHIRAGLETIISKHFGSHIVDELFELLLEKIKDSFEELEATYMDKNQLFVILRRAK